MDNIIYIAESCAICRTVEEMEVILKKWSDNIIDEAAKVARVEVDYDEKDERFQGWKEDYVEYMRVNKKSITDIKEQLLLIADIKEQLL